ISDFGLCRYSEVALYTTKGGKLPIKWMAIEALKQAEFTSKTDVWAYGVLLYELFTMGDTPYHSIQPTDMSDYLLAGNRLEQPNLCPDEMYELMRECWAERPEQRPTFEQIRQRIAAFLDVSSDSYGYVQVSATEYQRIYVTVKPALGENAPSTSKETETIEMSFENQVETETSFISKSDPDSGNEDAGSPMNIVQVETSSISRSSSIDTSSEDGVNKKEEELIVYDDDVL
uniref:Protein kinase domain-containing protein n=2 Tax=Acrobeloides nanus TaxID=290746 RepID=A0A914D9A4_9BILA